MKNRKNSGFTLVECVVAMAVLTICSLLLAMILSVTVNQRNENMQLERDIDSQVENLNGAGTDAPVLQPFTQAIVFKDGSDEVTVPGNGGNVSAQIKHYENNNVKLSSIDYNFDGYSMPAGGGDGGDGGGDGDDDDDDDKSTKPNYGSPRVEGGVKIGGTGKITVKQATATEIEGTGLMRYTWIITYKSESDSNEESINIQLPADADNVEGTATNTQTGRVSVLSNGYIRTAPKKGAGSITVSFDAPKGINLSEHFGFDNKDVNSINFDFIKK